MPSRHEAQDRDARDPLAGFRDEFIIPDPDLIYLDGNSLGRAPKATRHRIDQVLNAEWAGGLISSWEHWLDLPRRVGDQLGPIIGSRPGEVVVHDSTSINLYQAVHLALRLRPDRRVIVIDDHEFPTDRFVVEGIAEALELEVRALTKEMSFEEVAVVVRSVVDYRTAAMAELEAFTTKARSAGALVIWDLSHAAGAVEIDLHALGVDLAVGCSYKFLNGGPGAPAWSFVTSGLHEHISPPIRGWFGHRDQFAMDRGFEPHDDARQLLVGTPHILSLVAAEEGTALSARVGMPRIAAKGRELVAFAMEVADHVGLTTSTPRDPARRGCHLAIHHPDAANLVAQLARDHAVVADVRPPDIIRLGLSPLTTRFIDVWDGLERLHTLIDSSSTPERRP
ncbi:MAG: kynureninase [Ilumatobacteraceae bacterium]